MGANVKSILLLTVLLGAGPALAMEPDQAAPMGATGATDEERMLGPNWADIPDFRPEGPLLGQDFNRVIERLWEDWQRRQAEHDAEIVAACREVRFVMEYLSDRVPQQIDAVHRQMAAHPKALKPSLSGHRPDSPSLKDLMDREDYWSGAEAIHDGVCPAGAGG